MLRKLLSGGDDAVSGLVGVLRLPWPALLALRPSAELGVALCCAGFLSGRGTAALAPHLGSEIGTAGRPFMTATWAFHLP